MHTREFVQADDFDSTNYTVKPSKQLCGRVGVHRDLMYEDDHIVEKASRLCFSSNSKLGGRAGSPQLSAVLYPSATTDNTVFVSFEFRWPPLSAMQTYDGDLATFSSYIKTR